MKALFQLNQLNPLRCVNVLCLSAWRSVSGRWFQDAKTRLWSLSQRYAGWVTPITLLVLSQCLRPLFQNKRHAVGLVLLVGGLVAYFAAFFFSHSTFNHAPCNLFGIEQCYNFDTQQGWCFMSWYIYFDAVGWAVALLFWSVALMMFVPIKYTLSFIPASLFHAIGWAKILHVSFFARSYETYHSLPAWEIVFAALTLGFGIVMSANALLYWEHHKKRGNWQKWPLIFRSPLSQEEKNKLFAMADKEYDQVNKMI